MLSRLFRAGFPARVASPRRPAAASSLRGRSNHTHGLALSCGAGLLGALAWFGLDGIDVTEKGTMRELALRGGPWMDEEKPALLDYCESDVVALARLLPRLEPHIEHYGVPMDTAFLEA